MAQSSVNTHELEARSLKVSKLLDGFGAMARRNGKNAHDPETARFLLKAASQMGPKEWLDFAEQSGVRNKQRKPPSPTTIGEVLAALKLRTENTGPVPVEVEIEIDGPEYDGPNATTLSDTFTLKARVTGERVEWLSAKVVRADSLYDDAAVISLEDFEHEIGEMHRWEERALDAAAGKVES